MLARGWWLSPGTSASSTTKTGCHDIAEILLKVALKDQKSKIFRLYSVTVISVLLFYFIFHYFIQYKSLFHLWEIQDKIEGTKRVIRSRNREKGQTMIYNTVQKTYDRARLMPLSTRGELRFSGRASSSWLIKNTRRASVKGHEHHLILKSVRCQCS